MLSFAWDGITSFSVKPLKMITTMGFIMLLISIAIIIYTIIVKILGYTGDGWAFIMLSIWFIGGVQSVSIGLIGEYVGKIYSETKHRPRYIIEKELK